MLSFFGVMVVVLMISGEIGGFVRAVCEAASMTYLVKQLVVNLLIYLFLRFGC